ERDPTFRDRHGAGTDEGRGVGPRNSGPVSQEAGLTFFRRRRKKSAGRQPGLFSRRATTLRPLGPPASAGSSATTLRPLGPPASAGSSTTTLRPLGPPASAGSSTTTLRPLGG